MDGGEAQEVSEEDMLAIIEWVEKDNAKAKSNTDKAQSKQKKQFDVNHKPPTFQWETKCGCTTRERTLNRRKAGVELDLWSRNVPTAEPAWKAAQAHHQQQTVEKVSICLLTLFIFKLPLLYKHM